VLWRVSREQQPERVVVLAGKGGRLGHVWRPDQEHHGRGDVGEGDAPEELVGVELRLVVGVVLGQVVLLLLHEVFVVGGGGEWREGVEVEGAVRQLVVEVGVLGVLGEVGRWSVLRKLSFFRVQI